MSSCTISRKRCAKLKLELDFINDDFFSILFINAIGYTWLSFRDRLKQICNMFMLLCVMVTPITKLLGSGKRTKERVGKGTYGQTKGRKQEE